MEKLCCHCRKELYDTGDNGRRKGLMGVLETVKMQLKAGVDVKKGHVKGVEGLIEAGADVNKALKSAALHGHDQCVESLIKAGADVNMSCHLVVAVKSGSQRCVELLGKAGADVNAQFETPGGSTRNVLLEAVEGGNEEIVQLLLETGADAKDIEGNESSPLDRAASDGNFKIVDSLIKAGADVNKENQRQCSALMHVSWCSHETHPRSNFTKCMVLLLQAGADVKAVKNKHIQTPLVIAMLRGFDEGLDLLIKAGSDVNRYHNGLSPLMHAAAIGFHKCVLLTAGADVNETNDDRQTAFSCLGSRQRDYGYESIIPRHHEDLKEVLPKINIKECVKILLCTGARINHEDHKYKNNGLKNYIIQNVKVDRDICMFLYTAGETIDGTTIRATEIYYDHRDFWRAMETQCDVLEYLFFKDLRLDLKHLC